MLVSKQFLKWAGRQKIISDESNISPISGVANRKQGGKKDQKIKLKR